MIEPSSERIAVLVTTALILIACASGPETKSDRPPAEVGGCWSIAGYEHCDTTDTFGYKGSYSPDELALREQAKRFDLTVWQGALIGAVIGGAIGAASGGSASSAAGGATAGAAIGLIAGAYVAHLQDRYASKEDQLDAMTRDVANSNQKTAELIAKIRSVIAEDRRRLAAIQARVAHGQATAAELEQERGRIWSNRRVVEKATLGAKDQYSMFKDASQRYQRSHAGTTTVALEQGLTQYRKNLESLDRLSASMVKA